MPVGHDIRVIHVAGKGSPYRITVGQVRRINVDWLESSRLTDAKVIDLLFRTLVGRAPSAEEKGKVEDFLTTEDGDRREKFELLIHAVGNMHEAVQHGLFELRGETLTICLVDPGRPLPKWPGIGMGGGQILVQLKRQEAKP